MKLIGITRVRNESLIIKNTLDHVSKFVDGIIVCDDASTDDTVSICESHDKVIKVIKNKKWEPSPMGRNRAEGILRQLPYLEALKEGAEWVYYFDADEYVEFDFNKIDFKSKTTAYSFRLFDFYITEGDVNDDYLTREFMGPEYRDIPMLFKANPKLVFGQRIPSGFSNPILGGFVKHYGKAISVEEWDKTCEYYINHRWKNTSKELLERWKSRVGKAIHSKSDFNRELIKWSDRTDNNKIVKL